MSTFYDQKPYLTIRIQLSKKELLEYDPEDIHNFRTGGKLYKLLDRRGRISELEGDVKEIVEWVETKFDSASVCFVQEIYHDEGS